MRSITEESDGDAVLAVIQMVKRLKQFVGDLNAEMEERVVAHLQQHGDLVFGDIRYYAGYRKSVVCTNVRQAIEAVLEAVGGDLDAFATALISQPMKMSGCRGVLDASDFDRLFEKREKQEIKEGKPRSASSR